MLRLFSFSILISLVLGNNNSNSNSTSTSTTSTSTTTTTTTTTTTAASSNSSSGNATTSTTTTTVLTTTTQVPSEWIQVSASYTAAEMLPLNVTKVDLMASEPYMGAKVTGLAKTLSVTEQSILITDFEVTAPSSRRLEEQTTDQRRQLSSGNVDVRTFFKVTTVDNAASLAVVADIVSSAATLKTNIDNAMAATNWTGQTVLTTAPTIAGSITLTAPVVSTLPVHTTGSWTVAYFDDAACSQAWTGPGDAQLQGHIGTCTQGSINTGNSILATSCGKQLVVNEYQGSSTCTSADSSAENSHLYTTEACIRDASFTTGEKWHRVTCSSQDITEASGTTSTSLEWLIAVLTLVVTF